MKKGKNKYMNNNKKLLLVVSVLSMLSTGVMAKPIDMAVNQYIDEGGKNIYIEKITSTQDGVELKTPGIRVNLIDAIKIREVDFKKTTNGDGSDSYATINNGGSTYYNMTEKEENGAKISKFKRTVTEKGDFKIVDDYFVFKDGKRVKQDYKESILHRDGFTIVNNKYDSDYGTPNIGKTMYFTLNKVDVGHNKINNVMAGTADTDAVNVKQLRDYFNNNKTIVEAGDNITVTEDSGTYTVSTNKDLTNMNSVNLSDGNSESHYTVKGVDMTYRGDFEYHTQYNYDGVHIKVNDGDNQSISNEVSLTNKGLDNGNNKIINVNRGENDTDAVNVSQLKETNKKVNDNKKIIENHEGRITDLEHKTVDIGRNALERANHYTDLQVNKGVAKASALAGLKYLDYNPRDKWSFAASVGHYRNANAVAVGMAYQPNENTMIHGGITVDGKIAYNLGVSVKTGGQKYINKYELAEQVRQLQSDNAELRQELAELRSMIESNK